jgi:hypothetical protein
MPLKTIARSRLRSQGNWLSVSFTGEFSPSPYLKNMISTYTKDFPRKKWPKFAIFRKKKTLPIARLLLFIPERSQKCWRISIFSSFHINTCGQIWLNRLGDDSHLGYITKLEKETLGWLSVVWRRPHFSGAHVVILSS